MADLKSYVYPGMGEFAREHMSYAQAIRVGDRIVCSGQGGWPPNPQTISLDTLIPPSLHDEIDQAFSNVDHNLKHAGGKGWSQVYKVVTYSTPNIKDQHERIVENLRKWMPGHQAVWTELGVKMLGLDTMHFEIDVEAWDPEGARDAKEEGERVGKV